MAAGWKIVKFEANFKTARPAGFPAASDSVVQKLRVSGKFC
jgi:hypothetical protein